VPEILVKDLIKVYRTGRSEVIALRGIDVAFRDGEMVVIRGPSGCGKTTLLNLLGGLDQPTAGRIVVGGFDIVNYTDADLVRFRRDWVGFIFQFFNLVPTLTARENIELPMRLASKTAKEREERVAFLLKTVGLQDRGEHKPDELSGGEQQRISIAVSLALDPPIILADEPTGELDTKTGQEMIGLLKDLHVRLKKNVIIVTHDQRLAEYADRVLDIVDGSIVADSKSVAIGTLPAALGPGWPK